MALFINHSTDARQVVGKAVLEKKVDRGDEDFGLQRLRVVLLDLLHRNFRSLRRAPQFRKWLERL
jgi:hypothetical protein